MNKLYLSGSWCRVKQFGFSGQVRNNGSLAVRQKVARSVKKMDKDSASITKGAKGFLGRHQPTKEVVENAMNNAIVNFFQKPPKLMAQRALDQLILSNKNVKTDPLMKFTASNVSSLMFIAAKQKNQFGRRLKANLSITHHVPYLIEILESEPEAVTTNRDISNFCYGLKSIKQLTTMARGDLAVLEPSENSPDVSALQIVKDTKERHLSTPLKKLLEIVATKVTAFEGKLTKVDVGKIMFGLQGIHVFCSRCVIMVLYHYSF
jgi:hypothetical protein